MVKIAEPTRVCRDCGERKPWSDFHPKAKWPDGTTRQPHCYCKPCHQVRTNEWERQKAAADPGWRKRRGRRGRDLLKADPERYAASLAYRREWARERYGYRRVLRSVGVEGSRETLAPLPFADWLVSVMVRDGVSIKDVAGRFDVSDKTLREVLKGRRRVGLDTVERCLLADDTVSLRDLYPGLFDLSEAA